MNKVKLWLTGVSATVAGLAMSFAAHAQTAYFTVPTSTAPNLTASIGSQIGDGGTLLVIGVAAGIPLAFYVIHQLIGLLPKSRSRRQ